MLNDIKKSYELGWIIDKKLADKLVKKAEKIITIENRIDAVEEKNKKNKEREIEKLEQRVDKNAAKALLIELRGYDKNKINQQAFDIIKYDLEWLINN